ncbi:MAG: K(+)-transporting ATPase subunit F [Burkholderiales bacterium]
MTLFYYISGALALGVFVYLVAALFWPERF